MGERTEKINVLDSNHYTEEQLIKQAGAFRVLNKRVSEYHAQQEAMPEFIRDDEDAKNDAIATITRWVLEEHEADLTIVN